MHSRFIVVAPDLLRADSQENMYLEASGLRGQTTVSISIKDFTKSILLYEDTFLMDPEQESHTLRSIRVRRLDDPWPWVSSWVSAAFLMWGGHFFEGVWGSSPRTF